MPNSQSKLFDAPKNDQIIAGGYHSVDPDPKCEVSICHGCEAPEPSHEVPQTYHHNFANSVKAPLKNCPKIWLLEISRD